MPELLTSEEFYDRYAGRDYELVDGRVVPIPPTGPLHGDVDNTLGMSLRQFVNARQLGRVYTNTGFILRRAPDLLRGPDQAFVSAPRIARQPPPDKGFYEIAPDLIAEVVSPGDPAEDVASDVREYLRAGVRLIWVVYPRLREVHVFRPGERPEIVSENGVLDGVDVLPGFSLPLAELFA